MQRLGHLQLILLAGVILTILSASPANAQAKRVALLLANSTYKHIDSLPNPVRDHKLMRDTLKRLGFTVMGGVELDKKKMLRQIRRFSRALKSADVGLFYYAGHGIQKNGKNFLVATDARRQPHSGLINLARITEEMQRANSTNLVFLDACRDNPLHAGEIRRWRSIAPTRGLAPVRKRQGMFIAFATAPGDKAEDGSGSNSPFTAALARHLPTPGIDIDEAMRRVNSQVERVTNGRQVPWKHSSLKHRFVFNPADAPVNTGALPSWQTSVSKMPEASMSRLPMATTLSASHKSYMPGQRFRDEEHCPLLTAVSTRPGARPGFAIAVMPISNSDWQHCANDGICPTRDDIVANRPVTNINRYDLQPYLQWLNAKCASAEQLYRLPLASEWRHYRRTHQQGRKKLSWLNVKPQAKPHKIGASPKGHGLWEWGHGCAREDRTDFSGEPQALCPAADLLPPVTASSQMRALDPATRSARIGFRVVKELH